MVNIDQFKNLKPGTRVKVRAWPDSCTVIITNTGFDRMAGYYAEVYWAGSPVTINEKNIHLVEEILD